jgi:hypothetical protein
MALIFKFNFDISLAGTEGAICVTKYAFLPLEQPRLPALQETKGRVNHGAERSSRPLRFVRCSIWHCQWPAYEAVRAGMPGSHAPRFDMTRECDALATC